MLNGEEKAINLFKYIRELCALRYKVVTNIKNEVWYQFFNEIPYDKEYMKCPFLEENDLLNNENENSIILQITKLEFEDCPEIPDILKDWINEDWKNYNAKLRRKSQIIKTIDNVETTISFDKYFSENEEEFRNSLIQWNKKREEWIQHQKKIEKINNFFVELREKYDELKNNSESIKLIW
ncbi:hypothetical protein [Clostridium sp. MD294]|uniref:hypothetical protein n=1 Tax=Clostridium sp. MD294 TaxID=97138 RepID=UPI0002C9465D|nr:hypothetical protein [Clostridium sp. MD294]NDO45307.1 hypothetical protein [Clostridium sp. MD294]USF31056.1 hypothetical protein C820_002502 [Clostridium sp. MD294]